jgi:hypothetical protein
VGVYSRFDTPIALAAERLKTARVVRAGFWQGIDSSKRPELATHELLNFSLSVLNSHISKEELAAQIKPDLPWADDHFAERVSRIPFNPPPSEEWWPHAPKGNEEFKKHGIFSHTYPERYWPPSTFGIRFRYGNLDDLIQMLKVDPFTRQAYLPVWYPEDLGAPMDERKPCTLGYQFIMRDDQFHIVYYIRSCDFVRHFRNDIYLTVRLQQWVLQELQRLDARWARVVPGSFTMHITSLHLFVNDYRKIFPKE